MAGTITLALILILLTDLTALLDPSHWHCPTMSTSSIARPKTRATGKAGGISSAAPMGTTVPSAPGDTRMDYSTLPIPSGGEPMATSVDPEGSPVPSLFAHLMEDVTNLREAISVSCMREDSLFDRF
jgi:hypothetical protein